MKEVIDMMGDTMDGIEKAEGFLTVVQRGFLEDAAMARFEYALKLGKEIIFICHNDAKSELKQLKKLVKKKGGKFQLLGFFSTEAEYLVIFEKFLDTLLEGIV